MTLETRHWRSGHCWRGAVALALCPRAVAWGQCVGLAAEVRSQRMAWGLGRGRGRAGARHPQGIGAPLQIFRFIGWRRPDSMPPRMATRLVWRRTRPQGARQLKAHANSRGAPLRATRLGWALRFVAVTSIGPSGLEGSLHPARISPCRARSGRTSRLGRLPQRQGEMAASP